MGFCVFPNIICEMFNYNTVISCKTKVGLGEAFRPGLKALSYSTSFSWPRDPSNSSPALQIDKNVGLILNLPTVSKFKALKKR